MKRKFLSFIFSLILLVTFVGVRPVLADSAVVGTGSPASCTEAALNAALAELYPGATAPGGVLSFNCGPNPHTIVVTSEKFLNDGTVIDGGGLITLSGGNSTRIFFVSQQARVELRHIQLINGYAAGGGAIYMEPNLSGDYTYLTLNDVTLRDNNSTTFGGAINARHASLSVTNSHLTGNSSNGSGGAISLNEGVLTMINSEVLNNRSILAVASGGGLDVWNATLDIQTTTFRNNQSLQSVGGAILLGFCSGTIANSLIDQNTAALIGGGIYQFNGSVTLSQVTLTNNTAPSGGGIANDNGALVLNGATILTGNTSTSGGGIFNFNGQLAAQNVQLLNNQAAYGGGLYNSLNGTLTLADVTLSGNSATSGGGGMYNSGQSTLTRVTLALNTAGDGGAAFNTDTANLTLTNSTLSENHANFGGGVFNNGTLALTNITLAKNSALGGGGGILHNSGAASHLTMTNTLFSANTAFAPISNQCLLYEVPESQLFSLWQGVSCGSSTANGNQPNTDVALAPLSFSSVVLPTELTMTHAFLPLSPAKDAGTCGNAAPTTDQRGVARPQGAGCDIGSYESDATVPVVSSSVRGSINPTSAASVNFTVTFSESVTGVDIVAPFNDFALTKTGSVSGASVTGVSGSGTIYTVTVNTGLGNGTLRLDVADNNSIIDADSNPLGGVAVGDGNFTSGETYTVTKSAIFVDVPLDYSVNSFIERLYNAGITGGCSLVPLMYCPENTVTRAQMAVFLLRGIHGSGYTPPAVGAGSGFADVPTNHPVAAWIKQLAAEGITGGCGNGNYCPDAAVTRAQMAIFLLRSKYTSAYTPPPANGTFTDVPLSHSMVAWIEQLAIEGITGGCGAGVYCPDSNVTRAQMAVFLVRTFNLP